MSMLLEIVWLQQVDWLLGTRKQKLFWCEELTAAGQLEQFYPSKLLLCGRLVCAQLPVAAPFDATSGLLVHVWRQLRLEVRAPHRLPRGTNGFFDAWCDMKTSARAKRVSARGPVEGKSVIGADSPL